ncbi:MAG: 1-(5-phosphoribosyl)-5-((5-phosphoribosylamino)methylideneamino)imidazole-4-carboxamide isomerase [Betaproteobacteria bacterium 13_1_40CM_4_64_4]|nr:MAG: 1-(5-phosphoribosyl)-5-((5-phosphoribosylamino)methylideneamino)imidazole-4-carboxamide isomerase [Betaproteobacteria bacterium 13_1_40CM_4_64_4]
MAGIDSSTPIPTEIKLHQTSRAMELSFADGTSFRLPYEFLRVYSPSADVRGHGPGQETLQVGKRDVTIAELEPVGHYAVRPKFSDGHDTGIYSWDYLYDLGERQEELWQRYLARLAAAGASRDPDLNAPAPAPAHACGHHHDR